MSGVGSLSNKNHRSNINLQFALGKFLYQEGSRPDQAQLASFEPPEPKYSKKKEMLKKEINSPVQTRVE